MSRHAEKLSQRVEADVKRRGADHEQPQASPAFDQIGAPRRERLRHCQSGKGKRTQRESQTERRRRQEAGHRAGCDQQKPQRGVPPAQAKAVVEQGRAQRPEHHVVAGRQGQQGNRPGAEMAGEACRRGDRVGARADGEQRAQPRRNQPAVIAQQGGGDQQHEGAGAAAQCPVDG